LLGGRPARVQRRQLRDEQRLGGGDRATPGHALRVPREGQRLGRGGMAGLSPGRILRRLARRRPPPRLAGPRGAPYPPKPRAPTPPARADRGRPESPATMIRHALGRFPVPCSCFFRVSVRPTVWLFVKVTGTRSAGRTLRCHATPVPNRNRLSQTS